MKNKYIILIRKNIIFFVCMHLLGYFWIHSSIVDWQLQQTLMKQGISTEATVQECAFVRSGNCKVVYEYNVLVGNKQLSYYKTTHTSCVYCEDKTKIDVRYLPETPDVVAIEGERPIMYVFGIFVIIGAWLTVLTDFMAAKWGEWSNGLNITNIWQNTKD